MQWSLFLLILMGQCSLFTCQLYKYHFINKNKNWEEAQKYCREKYTDLATVYEETDIDKLRQSAKKRDKEAWIGLYNESVTDKNEWMWRWSQAEVEYTEDPTKWNNEEPKNQKGDEYCVLMLAAKKKKWADISCTTRLPFICYDAKNSSDKFYVSRPKVKKTWQDAQRYCRENHTDLISGTKQLEDKQLTSKLQNKKRRYWIGLFREPDMTCPKLDKSGTWKTDNCDSKKPFFCYKDKVILIQKNKTWEEAINHCREKYNDLISITDAEQQRWVQERAKNASSSHVWLGLRFTCILEVWFWVTDERVDYKNWASDVKMDDCDMSGAMETGGLHKWSKEDDMREFNFFCSEF